MITKSLTVLGATGSIGSSVLSVVAENKELFSINALVANKNALKLAKFAKESGAKMAVVADYNQYQELKDALFGTDIQVAAGKAGVSEAISLDADITVSSIVGADGLLPTVQAIKYGKTLALANKETLVCAGDIVMNMIDEYGVKLIPVDSEHSAIYQSLENNKKDSSQVSSIILTASGGPFREKSVEFMSTVTPEQAIAHPKWSMGQKISIDSATMMNKGLEIIEAYHLFRTPLEKIKVVIHPQSIIHSAVSYIDGAVLAELGHPDMRTPIAYALGLPERIPSGVKQLDFAELGSLTFFAPDEDRFPSLRLAKEVLKQGSSACCVLNAANEEAVAAFLGRQIGFLSIAKVVEKTLLSLSSMKADTIDEVISIDKEARIKAKDIIKELV